MTGTTAWAGNVMMASISDGRHVADIRVNGLMGSYTANNVTNVRDAPAFGDRAALYLKHFNRMMK
ncbi:hypothetical protein QE417_000399 [Mucilaginibacter terrae]|uniref:Uncharacterized protein n=1 Tax=Mucilaginibacter terrae TaxID=1955052 RepID=A0ABU3GNH1_9SPHI|nr:hypothetical protein [Mucilaginibacter terrae]